MKRLLPIPILIFTLTWTFALAQERIDSLMVVLKAEIDHQDVYIERKQERISAQRKKLSGIKDTEMRARFMVYNELYHEYKTFVNDSAFKYCQLLIQTSRHLKDPTFTDYARLKFGFTLLSAGLFKETFDTLRTINVKALHDSSVVDYYRLSARSYADLMVYNKHSYFISTYNQHYRMYMDSALMKSPPNSYSYFYLTSIQDLHFKNYEKVIALGKELPKNHKLKHSQYAVYYYDLAEAWLNLGNQDKGVENLILSCIADIRGAIKETAAMYTLARLLHNRGDSQNAYIFIRQALKDAQFYGARQRQVEINSILPLIAADQLNTLDEQRKRWIFYSGGITLIVILVAVFSLIIYRQLKQLRLAEAEIIRANRNLLEFNFRLVEADKIKEEYVGYYFNMTTDYVNRIDALRKQIIGFLVNDKKKEALTLLGKYNPGEERAKFVNDFDRVFLKLFPDFVQQFNKLINPAEPVYPESEGELNSDLRIYALIRLGIQDNKKIGEILNFSVNTIYAYKTRVKSKSIVPDDVFLKKVMEIKSIENRE